MSTLTTVTGGLRVPHVVALRTDNDKLPRKTVAEPQAGDTTGRRTVCFYAPLRAGLFTLNGKSRVRSQKLTAGDDVPFVGGCGARDVHGVGYVGVLDAGGTLHTLSVLPPVAGGHAWHDAAVPALPAPAIEAVRQGTGTLSMLVRRGECRAWAVTPTVGPVGDRQVRITQAYLGLSAPENAYWSMDVGPGAQDLRWGDNHGAWGLTVRRASGPAVTWVQGRSDAHPFASTELTGVRVPDLGGVNGVAIALSCLSAPAPLVKAMTQASDFGMQVHDPDRIAELAEATAQATASGVSGVDKAWAFLWRSRAAASDLRLGAASEEAASLPRFLLRHLAPLFQTTLGEEGINNIAVGLAEYEARDGGHHASEALTNLDAVAVLLPKGAARMAQVHARWSPTL